MDGVADTIRSKHTALEAVLDERSRRLWAAAEARALGRGGIARVVEATGMSRNTVRAGLSELDCKIRRHLTRIPITLDQDSGDT